MGLHLDLCRKILLVVTRLEVGLSGVAGAGGRLTAIWGGESLSSPPEADCPPNCFLNVCGGSSA